MRVISFITQKGGSGKTTLALNLAVAAAEAGETVALLDLDPQRMAVAWSKHRDEAQFKAEKAGKTDLAEKLLEPSVQAIPANRIRDLPALVQSLEDRFTLVFLDTQGADTVGSRFVMDVSTINLVPMRPTRADVEMAMPTVTALIAGDSRWAYVLTQCSTIPRNTRTGDVAAGCRSLGKLLEPPIHLRADYQDAYSAGLGVTEFSPKSKAADETRELWQNIDYLLKDDK